MHVCAPYIAGPLMGLLAAAAAQADVVQTLQGRLEGPARFANGQLEVAGKPVPWDSLLYAIKEQEGRSIRSPQAIRLASGEVWLVHLVGLSAKKLKVQLPLFGERELDVAVARSLDFLPDLAPPGAGDRPNTLYREKSEPIPGPLLWIDEQRLAIDSPLGVLTLQREGTSRYLLPSVKPPAPTKEDELSLVDGSTLRGTAKPAKDGVELEHAILGRVVVPDRALRSVLRRPSSAAYLTELAPQSVSAVPLIVNAVPPEAVEYVERGQPLAWPGKLRCLRGLRMEPKSSIRYQLPKLAGPTLALRATLGPIEGARGDVRVRIASGGKTLLEKELGPAAAEEVVSLNLPAGADLAIEADFGKRILFPCGILVSDPHVVGVQ